MHTKTSTLFPHGPIRTARNPSGVCPENVTFVQTFHTRSVRYLLGTFIGSDIVLSEDVTGPFSNSLRQFNLFSSVSTVCSRQQSRKVRILDQKSIGTQVHNHDVRQPAVNQQRLSGAKDDTLWHTM